MTSRTSFDVDLHVEERDISVIADFLKGSVEESLKKVVQPAGIVPAGALVLLNLGFVYPTAREDVPVVKAFADLDEVWQIVVVTAIVLMVGYLLVRSANWITAVLAGQTWTGSLVNRMLRVWQLRRLRAMNLQLSAGIDESANRSSLEWQRATMFPTGEPPERYVQATRLGNTLSATQHIVAERYGIDLTALWSQMESTEAVKEFPAIEAVQDAKATLDLLVNLTFALSLFGAEAFLYFAYGQRWDAVLASLLVIPLVYLTYRVADTSARSWGNAVEVTLDLHREKLRAELGLRAVKNASEKLKLWRQASRFYLPGSGAKAEDLFEPFPTKSTTVTFTPLIDVQKVSEEIVDGPHEAADGAVDLRSVEYLFLVSRKTETGRWAGVDFVVEDPRVTRIAVQPPPVSDGAVQAVATVRPAPGGRRLAWRVTGLQGGASFAVGYRLPLWRVSVPGAVNAPDVTREGSEYRLLVPGAGGTAVTLRFDYYGGAANVPPTVRLGGAEIALPPLDGAFQSLPIQLPADNPPFRILLPAVSSDGA